MDNVLRFSIKTPGRPENTAVKMKRSLNNSENTSSQKRLFKVS